MRRCLHALRGSVILIVLITVLFATLALTVFIEKASNDLLVDAREADANRLRMEAFSALETTLAVLEDFRLVIGNLHSPAEGWGDPLRFAGYEPPDGLVVEVQFIDESAKLSLPNVQPTQLVDLFKSWGLMDADAERLRDALLGWMRKDYVPERANSPRAEDYERGELPSEPAARPLRSFEELASIEYVRTVFYDAAGEPNELWHRFVDAFSLYAYDKANINGGNPQVLASLGVQDQMTRQRLQDFIQGTGTFQRQGPGYFKGPEEVGSLLGANTPAAELSTQIAALRILITVRQGYSSYRLNTVVAPQGGATLPENERGEQEAEGSAAAEPGAQPVVPQASSEANASAGKTLNYPFTILEIRENDGGAFLQSGSPDETT